MSAVAASRRRFGGVSPFVAGPHGVRVRLKVTPRAGSDRVEGLVADADGTVRLKVAVTAAADAGRANGAVVTLLARAWGVPRTRCRSRSAPPTGARRWPSKAMEPSCSPGWKRG